MTILIDVDEVLLHTNAAVVAEAIRQGHNVSLEDITAWNYGDFGKKTGWPPLYCLQTLWRVWTEHPEKIPLIDEAVVEVTNHIVKTYDADIFTANHTPYVKSRLEELGFDTTHFYQMDRDKKVDKTTLTKYNVLIEDDPTLKLNGHVWLLRDRPWNRHVPDAENIYRFYHSTETIRLIKQLEQQGLVQRR